ncbi:DsbA family protein [Corynebacterium choanae]|uniref:DSBA-like thioredoxin domain protein n=1 Tax=Corynebacterium choanae TaxID=1862358 RepID=A0A3G6J8P3_9CORY|nr:thioredoxin domain-containing protein [Corynebacterium choanae]AZA14143.1 DSBA-like thioredoxin domain protein [Corynebacterium choanae]
MSSSDSRHNNAAQPSDDPQPQTLGATEPVEPETTETAAPVRRNGFALIPPAAWGLFAAAVIAAFAGGYLVGVNSATPEPSTESSTHTQAPAANATDTPDTPTFAEVQQAGLQPGTAPVRAKAPAAGWDSYLFGPREPLQSAEDVLNVHRRNPADPFAIGAIDAPVVITMFSDFECPFCARFAQVTEPTILDKYVNDGWVRIEFNDMPINGDHAVAAAKAGRAAAKQGKFNEFEAIVFSQEKATQGHPNNTIDNFVEFAKQAGVADLEQFRTDATSDAYDQVVADARSYASGLGVNGTPAFVIGETYISGAQPTEVFEQVINMELMKVATGKVAVPSPQAATK